MTFEQALEELYKGYRVRLSDWAGYWFIPKERLPETNGTDIRVFTRDGDILDTPNIDRYKDRDDWEVVTQIGWPFDMALRFMKNGKKCRRAHWGEGWAVSCSNTSGFALEDSAGNRQCWYPHAGGVFGDLLANDWQIVNA